MAPGPDRPVFFDDPATDALVAMVMELARETWVTRARLAALERAAEGAGIMLAEAPGASDPEQAAELQAFVKRLLGVLEGIATAPTGARSTP